ERTGDNTILLRLTQYAGRDSGIDYAMVVDTDGRVLQHTDVGRVHSVAPSGAWEAAARRGVAATNRGSGAAAGTVEFAAPIYGANGPRGAAVVGMKSAQAAVGWADARPLILPAAFMLLMIPLTFMVVRFSVRPLLATGEELRALLAAQSIPGLPAFRGSEPH